jgi:serine/threonine protein kinase
LNLHHKYAILSELGTGQSQRFGRVFLGLEKSSGIKVIIKALRKELSARATAQLINESSFTFDQTGLPTIIEVFESDSELILVKKFQEGETLAEYWNTLKKGTQKIEFAKKMVRALVPLFSTLEKQNIIHCDIKPSNILIHELKGEIEISLIDFGLAVNASVHKQRALIFPLGFAAPELILNRTDLVDQRTDIFSLGITLWYLFSGKLPLSHPNPSVYTNLQLTHPLQDESAIPKGWFPILSKMAAKHSFRTAPNRMSEAEVQACLLDGMGRRYQNLQEVLDDLQKLSSKRSWFGF